jgi:hypothetical protein
MAGKGKDGKVLTTSRMPSGAQQYVRGKTTADRMDTIIRAKKAVPSSRESIARGTLAKDIAIDRRLSAAFMDEADKSKAGRAAKDRARKAAGGKPLAKKGE